MTRQEYTDICGMVTGKLINSGIFLTAGTDQPNTMTVGWGGLNFYYGKAMFTAPIRYSRFTYPLIVENKSFTISVPIENPLADALKICGTKSGRDTDKYTAAGLTPVAGRVLSTPVIAECGLHLECRVLMQQSFDPACIPADIQKSMYPTGDFHTLFYGEIVACYPT